MPLFLDIIEEDMKKHQPIIINEAEDDPPDDYTTDDAGDAGGGDAGAAAATADTGADQGAADQGADPGADPTAANDQPQDANTPEEAPEDYTVPDEGGEGENADGADPNAGGDDPNAGGDDAGGADPNAGGDEAGGDDAGGDTGGGTDDTGDTGGDDTGGGDDDEIKDLEKEVFADLTPQQLDIKHIELKNRYMEMYNDISTIVERINDIPKSNESIKTLEFVSNTLNDLTQMITDYLTNTYNTKSYIENEINFNKFMVTLNGVRAVLTKVDLEDDGNK